MSDMVSVLILISYFKSSHLLTYFFICFRVKKKIVPTAKTKSKVIFLICFFWGDGGGSHMPYLQSLKRCALQGSL